uniref:Uncharacterized protein n=1 Tax=Rhizobium rhizogenes TaxID=359 RepID=A0A7S4ZSY0_RHIRH|nr:hypothetical protein pC5.7c_568 [Rhizobium rhizogenes]QCL09604.1 hypothetical protein pC5.8a_112 [Rhizobium rhizogenes]
MFVKVEQSKGSSSKTAARVATLVRSFKDSPSGSKGHSIVLQTTSPIRAQ